MKGLFEDRDFSGKEPFGDDFDESAIRQRHAEEESGRETPKEYLADRKEYQHSLERGSGRLAGARTKMKTWTPRDI